MQRYSSYQLDKIRRKPPQALLSLCLETQSELESRKRIRLPRLEVADIFALGSEHLLKREDAIVYTKEGTIEESPLK